MVLLFLAVYQCDIYLDIKQRHPWQHRYCRDKEAYVADLDPFGNVI